MKILAVFAALIALTGMVAAQGAGSIWTTTVDCGDPTQDVNHFAIGDEVHINGANFAAGDHEWDITGNPGGASCDTNIKVAYGTITVDSSGAFCIHAYTVAADDCGEYSVKVGSKGDNYRVDGAGTTTTTEEPTTTEQPTTTEEPTTTEQPTTTEETTTTRPTSTTTTIPNVPEFASMGAIVAILLSAPAFAYLIVRSRKK